MIASATGIFWTAAPFIFAGLILFSWNFFSAQVAFYAELKRWSSQQIAARDALLADRANKKPNYAAVRRQHQYAVGAASRLWVDRDPNIRGTPDSQAWYETFVSAIQRGELRFQPRWPRDAGLIRHEQQTPAFNTMVTREEFKRYAAAIGEDPPFLRDE